jgi:hypothetical protein
MVVVGLRLLGQFPMVAAPQEAIQIEVALPVDEKPRQSLFAMFYQ